MWAVLRILPKLELVPGLCCFEATCSWGWSSMLIMAQHSFFTKMKGGQLFCSPGVLSQHLGCLRIEPRARVQMPLTVQAN